MKSEKGITVTSLIIYVIALTVVIASIAMLSNYFYRNTSAVTGNINPITEYTKFNTFFSEEVNHSNIKVLECKQEGEEGEGNYIVFDNGVQYTFIKENEAIYKDKVKICTYVKECSFTHKIQNGKNVVTVSITMENSTTPKIIEYTLKN